MARIITAPEKIISDEYSVFLAGAIDMGKAVDWQSYVIDQLSDRDDMTIFNPRRIQFTQDTLDEQVRWELEALERANTIFMWLPKNALAPVSMFEAGLFWQSGKLYIGAEPGFYRRRNLELTGERYGITIHSNLSDMVASLRHYNPVPAKPTL